MNNCHFTTLQKRSFPLIILLLAYFHVASQNQHALDFDSYEQSTMTIPYNSDFVPGQKFTVEAWVKPRYTASMGQENKLIYPVIGFDSEHKGSKGFTLSIIDGGKLSFQYGTPPRSWSKTTEPTPSIKFNIWQHIAAVYDNRNVKIFVDGIQVAESNFESDVTYTDEPFYVGYSRAMSTFYEGVIDEVRIWHTARTRKEIQDNKDWVLVKGMKGLVMHYEMNNSSNHGEDKTGKYPAKLDGTMVTSGVSLKKRPCICNDGEKIIVKTQKQIDDFSQKYGRDCNYVSELRIEVSSSQVDNLRGLIQLDSITDMLYIIGHLKSLKGLDNLLSIGGNFSLSDNNELTSLAGLQNLTSVGGNFGISFVKKLTTDSKLEKLKSIGGNLTIFYNSLLSDFEFLKNLTTLKGDLRFSVPSPLIAYFKGLENLTSIGGVLSIAGRIPDLQGLENITSIGGNLEINGSRIKSLEKLKNVTSIGGDLFIMNTALVNLNGLENITAIPGKVDITRNFELVNIDGLRNITSISKGLIISQVKNLKNIDALKNVTSIGGNIFLQDLTGLINLDGLININEVNGYLIMEDCTNIKDLKGLQNITSINGDLLISYTDYISSLSPLIKLKLVKGKLQIRNNKNLESLTGLDNINFGRTEGVSIQNNPKLSMCHISNLCENLDSPPYGKEFSGNAKGCNKWEIDKKCKE